MIERERDYIAVEEELKKDLSIDNKIYTVIITPYVGWQGGGVVIEGIGHFGGSCTYTHEPTKERHCCGLMGYNPMLGDNCPACDVSNMQSHIMHEVVKQLKKEEIIKTKKEKVMTRNEYRALRPQILQSNSRRYLRTNRP